MNTLWIMVVDADYRHIKNATVRVSAADGQLMTLQLEDDRWTSSWPINELVTIQVSARGFEPEIHRVVLRERVTQVVIGLRKAGQLSYSYGNNRLAVKPINDATLLHVVGERAVAIFTRLARSREIAWQPVVPETKPASNELFVRVNADLARSRKLSDELKQQNLRAEISLILQHGERLPSGLTNELIVRFLDDVKRIEAERLAASVGLVITRELRHAGNAFVLRQEGDPSYDILKIADTLSESGRVVYVEPNITFAIEPDQYTPNDPLWNQVPHLQLINADDAWDRLDDVAVNLRGGSPNITIAVIDLQGVTPNHPDLTANLTDGTSKLITSMDFAASPIVAQTVAGLGGDHGTQCAASATAAFDDNRGMPGVAPNCHLIGAQIGGAANAVLMADIYMWVAGFLNGSVATGFPTTAPSRAADVISSSWGNTGLALSNTVRDCFDFLTTYGRGGKGCVLCFSLGNSGYGDYTLATGTRFRAWPTYEKTIGVGSSISVNPTNPVAVSAHADPNGNTNNVPAATDTRSLFSPFGATALRKPDLVAPSHTAYAPAGLVDPILSAVRVGTGAVDGCPGAPVCNDYATTFGGTSHSTPTVAGAVALILSARPDLNWVQVRDILRLSCVRIDAAQANAVGQWQDLDGDTLIDYSRWYGAGRLDVDAAVAMALDTSLPLADAYVRENLTDTGTVPSTGDWWASPDIWVRQDSGAPVRTLAWSDPAPHENAKRGQDNAVFCRVRNRGAATATTVYLRAMLTHWAGLEFVYPADFQPSTNVGAPIPSPLVPGTYLLGEARIDNLTVGTNQIVKFPWPQALIPPETVAVSGATVRWHPCLLVEASPHDGPTPVGGLSVPVRGNNNIAQRNIQIDDAADSTADLFVGVIAGSRDIGGVATLVLDATNLRNATSIRVHVVHEPAMTQIITAATRGGVQQCFPMPTGQDELKCAVIIEQRTRVRVECGACDTVIEVAPGSRIFTGIRSSRIAPTATVIRQDKLDWLDIRGLRGRVEFPMRLAPSQFVPLLVGITGPAMGDLWITQRRGDGDISAGYGVRRVEPSS